MATTKPVLLEDPKFDSISTMISSSFPNSCVLWIDEVINDQLLARYIAKKEEYYHKYKNELIELQLFHGTNENNIAPIVQDGFKAHLNKRSAYGKGNYFSTMAGYSKSFMTSDTSISFMFLCDILIGDKCSHDQSKTVGIYVIPDDDSCFPRYIIAFHKNPVL